MSGFAIDPEDEAATVVGLLDRLLDTGVHVAGDLVIGLADIELVRVALRLLVASEDTAQRTGVDARLGAPRPHAPDPSPTQLQDEATTPPSTPPAGALRATAPASPRDAGPDRSRRGQDDEALADGVARLVLTVVAVVHDLVEKQAVRRVESGRLSHEEVERLGVALQALEDRMARVRAALGIDDEDLNLDLGPLGRLR